VFPEVLLKTPNWLNYFLTSDGRKVPLDSKTGRGAFKKNSGERAASRSTYEEACRRNPRRLGFDLDEPFLGVDLDHVLEAGKLTSRGAELLAALPKTYTEISPSGTGLHLYYLCGNHHKLPNLVIGDAIEIYSRLRWFTATNVKFGNSVDFLKLLSEKDARGIFALGILPEEKQTLTSIEPGFWTTAALLARLEAWKKFIPGFDFRPDGNWPFNPVPRAAGLRLARRQPAFATANASAAFGNWSSPVVGFIRSHR
jgi:hypothetical protein